MNSGKSIASNAATIREIVTLIHFGFKFDSQCEDLYSKNGRAVIKFLRSYREKTLGSKNKGEIKITNLLAKLNDDVLIDILSFCNRDWWIVELRSRGE